MNHTGCLICGKPLQYFISALKQPCERCGLIFETNAVCENGHYICDPCHAQFGLDYITNYALKTEHHNPIIISTGIMENELINMHGPEHHYLVVASLLAAYNNSNGGINLQESLKTALQRAKHVPGGICGFWGSCGAGICCGIFISIITEANPLSGKEWRLANLMTAQALYDISQHGGPRCCKRDTYLALNRAVQFVKEQLNVDMETSDSICCTFWQRNKQCKKEDCLFYPQSGFNEHMNEENA